MVPGDHVKIRLCGVGDGHGPCWSSTLRQLLSKTLLPTGLAMFDDTGSPDRRRITIDPGRDVGTE